MMTFSNSIPKLTVKILCLSCALCVVLWPAMAAAVKSVSVQGLLGNKAVLLVDGKRHVVNIGNSTPDGVKLVSIQGDAVVLEIDGQQRKQSMGDNVVFNTQYVAPQSHEVLVTQNNNGLFTTVGSINGLTVNLLVDTGANIVTLNARHARRLGVAYEEKGDPVMVATASGIVKAYRVILRSVSVGQIELQNVAAVVMTGPHPAEILLGMSFLGGLEIQRNGNVMKIKKNY